MKMFAYDKESVKKVLQIAWPAMLESFFCCVCRFSGFIYGKFFGTGGCGICWFNHAAKVRGTCYVFLR